MSADMTGLIACALMGGGVGLAVWWVVAALSTDDVEQDDQWRYDVSRINSLRRADVLFRVFQPAIQTIARLNRQAFRNQLPEVERQVQAAGLSRFWLPEEYLARTQLIALLLLPLFAWTIVSWSGDAVVGVVFAVFLALVTAGFLRYRLARLAQRRVLMIKRRMPYLLDLLTLLMEAGSSFLQALKQSVVEFEGHPIAVEFGRVLTDMNMGKTRTESLDNMRYRLKDDEVSSILGSIIQGEELGTPLAEVFRTQSDVLRVKRSQRAETIAGEAGVNMLLPGILVMMACIIVILGPFILGYLRSGLF
jgi:tight adherence protein C